MPEATVILFDNSEFMRNADYIPTRLGGQVDTVGVIAQAKCDSNPENTVAMVSTSGRPSVVLTLTSDVAKVFTCTDRVPLTGTVDIINSFNVASLLLNHRVNKIHHQRIIALVGSPILPDGVSEEQFMAQIESVGKKLKANRVALDIVSFGEVEQNERFLKALFNTVCGDDPSQGCFLTVNPGTKLIADCVMCSAIVLGEAAGGAGGASAAASSAAGFGDFGAFGYEDDPELALAIAESLKDEQRRQEAAAQAQKAKSEAPKVPETPSISATQASDTIMADDDDDDLQAVLQMTPAGLQTPASAPKPESSAPPPAPSKTSVQTSDFTPDLVSDLLSSVGVDPTAFMDATGQNADDKNKKDDKKNDDDTSMTDK